MPHKIGGKLGAVSSSEGFLLSCFNLSAVGPISAVHSESLAARLHASRSSTEVLLNQCCSLQ